MTEEKLPESTGIEQEKRDEKGRFVSGVSGNPAGRPKGSKHMTTLLTEALLRVAEGSDEPEDLQIVKSLIERAKSGDVVAIREVWDRMEGKPQQAMDVTSGGDKINFTWNDNNNDTVHSEEMGEDVSQ